VPKFTITFRAVIIYFKVSPSINFLSITNISPRFLLLKADFLGKVNYPYILDLHENLCPYSYSQKPGKTQFGRVLIVTNSVISKTYTGGPGLAIYYHIA
jgi:hypothetical protein